MQTELLEIKLFDHLTVCIYKNAFKSYVFKAYIKTGFDTKSKQTQPHQYS